MKGISDSEIKRIQGEYERRGWVVLSIQYDPESRTERGVFYHRVQKGKMEIGMRGTDLLLSTSKNLP